MTPKKLPLLFIFILGILLPLPILSNSPLHHDEALYGYWAKLIVSGQDIMLNSVPIDKPPLFIYLLALCFKIFGVSTTVARYPSLIAHLLTIGLTYKLGHSLYNKQTGLLAALLITLSPFTILFAPTILTDPLMLTFILGAILAAVNKKPVVAGTLLSLAVATKQQGIFFLPLVLGFILIYYDVKLKHPLKEGKYSISFPSKKKPSKSPPLRKRYSKSPLWGNLGRLSLKILTHPLITTLITLTIGLIIPLIWDWNRTYQAGFWIQSSLSYGPIGFGGYQFIDRLLGFINLLKLATDNPILNLIFIIGLPILLLTAFLSTTSYLKKTKHIPRLNISISLSFTNYSSKQKQNDWLLSSFSLLFILLHAFISFQIWDRYMLGLIPLLALLLARILHIPLNWVKLKTTVDRQPPTADKHLIMQWIYKIKNSIKLKGIGIAVLWIIVIALITPSMQQALHNAYQLGGDHGAYAGTAEIAAYLQGNVGANVTLYHHKLGAHWRYYLFGFPYDLRYWQSPNNLAKQAQANAEGIQYIAFPPWQSSTPAELALSDVGLHLEIVFRTVKLDGSPGIYLYQINTISNSK